MRDCQYKARPGARSSLQHHQYRCRQGVLHFRSYSEAIAQFKRALDMDPDFPVAHGLLAVTYAEAGMHAEAEAEIAKVANWEERPDVPELVMFMPWLGRRIKLMSSWSS